MAGLLIPVLTAGQALAWSEINLQKTGTVPCLVLWRPRGTCAVLGLSQDPETELHREAIRSDAVPVVRRQSGGGAVLLYHGVLCWEAWAGIESIREFGGGDGGIRDCYRFFTLPVQDALNTFGLQARQAGICDVSILTGGGVLRKVAGTAQLRRGSSVLVHGSLLVSADLSLLGTYLRFPSSQPDYREGRAHTDFCTTIRDAVEDGGAVSVESVGEAILAAARRRGWRTLTPDVTETAVVELERRKYKNEDWNWHRRRPENG